MVKVTVQIVTRNSKRYITNCLESLEEQSFADFSVVVVDNASTDGTDKLVRSTFPTLTLLENFKNHGFAKGHNQALQLSQSEYVLVLNPDIVLTPTFLEDIIRFADKKPEAASFGGKLLRLKSEAINRDDQVELRDVIKTETIDTAGLTISRTRKATERGSGQHDNGQFDRAEEVFGISGACVLYRRSALEEVKIGNDYFDNDFFVYKEDVDLAWRLRLFGFSAWYVPQAVGYHHRGLGSQNSFKADLLKRKKVPVALRASSFRNHFLMLVKNEQWTNIFLALPWWVARQASMFGYALLMEPFQWKSVGSLFALLPSAFRKRREIMRKTKVQPRDIRKWFGKK